MLVVLTFMAALLSLVFYVLINHITFPEDMGIGFIISLFIVLGGLGGHLLKYAMFHKEHMSKLRYIGGVVVLAILALSFNGYLEMWEVSKNIWHNLFLIWLAVLALFILSVPVLDFTEEQEQAEV